MANRKTRPVPPGLKAYKIAGATMHLRPLGPTALKLLRDGLRLVATRGGPTTERYFRGLPYCGVAGLTALPEGIEAP